MSSSGQKQSVADRKDASYYQSDRQDMLSFIPADSKKTLEFGCGTGEFSSLVKNNLKTEAWAVEIDKIAAEQASKKLDKVICADAHESLARLPDKSFDCIIFFDILEHLIDPYSLLENIKPKLTDNGVVIASIPNIRYYRAFKKFVISGNWDYTDQGIMDRTHLRFFTKKSILKMFDGLDYDIKLIKGIHPTSSRTYSIMNLLFCGALSDLRYKHYVVVASPS